MSSAGGLGSPIEWPPWMPWLYDRSYRLDLRQDIPTTYTFDPDSPNSKLKLVVAKYLLNGSFVGIQAVTGGTLQLCKNEEWILDAAFVFGRQYKQSCEIYVQDLWNKYSLYFFDLYLEYENDEKEKKLYPVPIFNQNFNDGMSVEELELNERTTFVRRLFLVDNVAGKSVGQENEPNSRAKVVRYPKLIQLRIELQDQKDGHIYPPWLFVEYGEVKEEAYDDNGKVRVGFEVVYKMETVKHEKDLEITMGVLCSIGALWTIVKTLSWFRRAGKQMVDFFTVFKFLFYMAGTLADVFFIVMLGTSLWILMAYKYQKTVVYMVLARDQEFSFTVYVGVAAGLKALEMIHLLIEQVTSETYFIDWERPRGSVIPKVMTNGDEERGEGGSEEAAAGNEAAAQEAKPNMKGLSYREESPVTIWRTYLIANEWNELCTYRKTSYTLQLFLMIVALKILHLENVALIEPDVTFGFVPREFQDSRMCRFAIAAGLYLAFGLGQWFINVFIVERCIVNHFGSFVDLCSISNISVLCLTRPLYGFYIHGRSVHGHADTNMREMNEMLQRERDNLCSLRGLEATNDVQSFTVSLPFAFREELEAILQPLRNPNLPGDRLSGMDLVTAQTQNLISVYNGVNTYFCNLLEKKGSFNYSIADQTALEAILDLDFGDSSNNGIFQRDYSESGYSSAFLYGQEWIQLSFDTLLFCAIDLIAHDYLISSCVTFAVITILRKFRELGGTRRLVKTSLVDSRFLI